MCARLPACYPPTANTCRGSVSVCVWWILVSGATAKPLRCRRTCPVWSGHFVDVPDGRWYVGPDNGWLVQVIRRAQSVEAFRILWRPEHLSCSFHGRDLFAPVAAMLACGEPPEFEMLELSQLVMPAWPDDLAEVVYVDHFGNLFRQGLGE